MNDDIKLPPLPRLQVPRIDADIDLADIRRLAKWCEGIATSHARAAVEADRARRAEPAAWLRSDELRKLGRPGSDAPLRERSDSMMLHAKGTPEAAEKYGFDVPVYRAPVAAQSQAMDALRALEDACNTLCLLRTREQYLSMIDSDQGDALQAVDDARAQARRVLAAPVTAQPGVLERIERRVYKNSSEYSPYLHARFANRSACHSFEWEGHRWMYRYTSFDDRGDYDLIYRNAAAPTPSTAHQEK